MFINRLFREQALARRRRQEPLDDRLQVTAPHEWILVVGLGLMFLALLVYGAVGSIERSLSYNAVVVFPGERYPVSAPASGTVLAVLTEVGDTVESGQVIARLSPAMNQQRGSEARRLLSLQEDEAGQSDDVAADVLLLLLTLVNPEDLVGADVGVEVVSVSGGEIMALGLAPGMPVNAGEPVALVRAANSGPLEALALVPSGDAERIEEGITVQVSIARGNRETITYAGEVVDVSAQAVTPPEWLVGLGISAPAGSHLVRVRLEDAGMGDAVVDGSTGSMRVVLGRSSFLSVLAPRGGS